MTKNEAMRQTEQENTLVRLGFTTEEAAKLRRISMTLQRWHELSCGIDSGCVERDEQTGKTKWRNSNTGKLSPFPDRETGALKRLADIVENCNRRRAAYFDDSYDLNTYIQTDPRGAALYILRLNDIPDGKDPAAYYSRGICVY
jgi:hypothetical protein